MAKRGRKPKIQTDDTYESYEDGPVKENFLDTEEELLYHLESAEIERYIRPHRKFEGHEDSDEDSFAYWYGQN